MDLILAEQALLIALDDAKGRNTTKWAGDAGLAAAVLLDLARLDLVEVDDDKHIVAVDGRPPEHELLRDAHAAIAAPGRQRTAKGWVSRLPRELKPLLTRLARGLVERGVLAEEHRKLLGLIPATRFPEADPGPERDLRARLRDVLVVGRAPTEEEALLVGLLEPLELIGNVVERDERRAARTRAKEVAEQGIAGTAVRDAVAAVQAAVMASAVAASVTATSSS